jgi:MFS family permease
MRARLGITDDNRRWWILAAASAGVAMAMLDEAVVAVALETIREDLGMSELLSHSIVNAYLLSLTVFVVGGGRLGDVFGHRPVMLGGAVLFGLGSLASGLAQSGEWIIVARAVQGVGAAAVFSITVAMIGRFSRNRSSGAPPGSSAWSPRWRSASVPSSAAS